MNEETDFYLSDAAQKILLAKVSLEGAVRSMEGFPPAKGYRSEIRTVMVMLDKTMDALAELR